MSRDDEAWAELVEAFHASPDAEPDGSERWPDAENVDPNAAPLDDLDELGDVDPDDVDWDAQLDDDRPGPAADDEPRAGRTANTADTSRPDPTDHFVPPVALIVMTVVAWTPPSWIVFLMVTGFVGGFGTLVARMRGHHPHDPDDGAVL